MLQGGGYVPGLQPNNHRTPSQQTQTQTMLAQPTPGFMQQRGQSSFAFGGGLGHSQSATSLQQQQPPQPPSQQQQQQTNGTSNSLPPHLSQTPSLGTAPSVSSASEGFDPNDFPALGSTPANNTSSSSNGGNAAGSVATSYASQAGTGVPLGGAGGSVSGAGTIGGGTGGSVNANQTRDFTPDDFPALGGQSQASLQPTATQENHSHPPGLNGFQHTDHSQQQQHRQNLLGALTGVMPQGTPGMLNLGPAQARNVHPGFQQQVQTEAEKQQQRVRVYPPLRLG